MGEHIITETIKTIVTLDTIELPENPTNGDVIKAMFPDAEIRFTVNLSDMHAVHVKFGDNTYICYDNHLFSREWWNAPYKRGE